MTKFILYFKKRLHAKIGACIRPVTINTLSDLTNITLLPGFEPRQYCRGGGESCHHDTTFADLHLPRSLTSQVFGSKRDCEQLRCIAHWTMGTLSVGAKDAGKDGHFSLRLSHVPCTEPKTLQSLSITDPLERA